MATKTIGKISSVAVQKHTTKKVKATGSAIANKQLLTNAWRRVLLSGDAQYKNFERLEMQAFGTAFTSLLDLVHTQLVDENYEPQPTYKIHLPKAKYATRTLTLLSMPDLIVYTAITTLIMEAAIQQEKDIYNKVLFSNVPLSRKTGRSTSFFRRWNRQYPLFNKASKNYVADGYHYLAETDIASFYDFIDHDLLLELIKNYFKDTYALELLERMLKSWSSAEGIHQFAHGIPQAPDASRYLADLFLYSLDKHMFGRSNTCRYARYVDDIRVFCKTRRIANAESIHLEEEIKKLGLVPNVSKVRVIDARTNLDWLKEESSEAQALGSGFMGQKKIPKSLGKRRHLLAKPQFMKNCKAKRITPMNTYLTRRSLPKLLPDREVIQKIMKVYTQRPDLYNLFFVYLRECKNTPELARFCWKQLKEVPIRDWECANLIEVAISSKAEPLTKHQTNILCQYMNDSKLPFAAAKAAGILFRKSIVRPVLAATCKLPTHASYIAHWLVPILGLRRRRTAINRSIKAIVKRLLKSNDPRTSFITSYLIATKFSISAVSTLPIPQSPYSRHLLMTLGQTTINPLADEIAPLLVRIFRVKISKGFNFRSKLGTLNPQLYNRALRQLQLASWYLHTHPTYFVNHVHNFNHVLLHFALHSGNFIPKPPLKWKYTFGELAPNRNPNFVSAFPATANVFRECSKARNTNLSSHPFDDSHSRFTKLVTYEQRDKLISKLRVAYTEFMAKA